jgi:wyosine [tRNA(Phe)-imidazoG37] synthetase (radical SAM superfamily)
MKAARTRCTQAGTTNKRSAGAVRPMKIIYGPVPSWRLGRSLGVDPICSRGKICSFDCIYCQLGRTKTKTMERKPYVNPAVMKRELEAAPKDNIDAITFSGTGEPTLNSELGDMICFARKFGIRVAVLTNSSLLADAGVRRGLCHADAVAAKLDAPDEGLFQKINNPAEGLRFQAIVDGIMAFRKEFRGKLMLQMMFVGLNKERAGEMARLAQELGPDEVQLDTPLRRSPVPPLSPEEMAVIERHFSGLPVVQVYKSRKPETVPFDIHETGLRRPGRA